MIAIFVFLLIAGLLLLAAFIYFRIRRSNEKSRDGKLPATNTLSARGGSRVVIKSGDNTIIKTTGLADDKSFFHNN